MWQYQKTDELYHHGVIGMKWGIRRYQNKDGSLTAKGKKRYSSDYNEAQNIKRKGIKRMSNEDLRKVNNRDQLERTYKLNNKSKAQKGASAIAKGAKIIGTTAGVTASIITLTKNAPEIISTGKKIASKFKHTKI